MKTKDIQFKRFDDIKDKYLGKEGTQKRDQYEFDLKLDVLGDMIKRLRNEKNLTQEQLGEMIGVKRSEISKLERGSRNMTVTTVLKIFRALKVDIKFKIETKDNELKLV
ncbi:MAG: helix-turn-helix domain-containing protein [Bacteroidales bacterium]|nr:helix-turn-helix domain-containing protein [Bacteroidales bacterium]